MVAERGTSRSVSLFCPKDSHEQESQSKQSDPRKSMGKVGLAFCGTPAHIIPVPRKIRQLLAELERAGFRQMPGAGKGSHRKYVHVRFRGFVLISGAEGDDARPYQEKHVRNALRQLPP